MLTTNDIPQYTGRNDWTDTVTLKDGYSVRVNVVRDEYCGEPWKECDGHGPVSGWRPRDSKRPGERILHSDRNSCLFYDFAGAVALARRDGWGSKGDEGLTGGAKAAHAAEADFEYLRRWCNGEWYYVVVGVEVSRRSAVVGEVDYCGGIESGGDYWREHAADNARWIIAADQKARKAAAVAKRKETIERAHWAARDVATV